MKEFEAILDYAWLVHLVPGEEIQKIMETRKPRKPGSQRHKKNCCRRSGSNSVCEQCLGCVFWISDIFVKVRGIKHHIPEYLSFSVLLTLADE